MLGIAADTITFLILGVGLYLLIALYSERARFGISLGQLAWLAIATVLFLGLVSAALSSQPFDLANLILLLGIAALLYLPFGLFWPRFRGGFRRRSFLVVMLSLAITIFVASEAVRDPRVSGLASYNSGNWSAAVDYLSQVPQSSRHYEEIQPILDSALRRRATLNRRRAAKEVENRITEIEEEIRDRDWDEAQALISGFAPPSVPYLESRFRAAQDLIRWGSRLESYFWALSVTNIRSGPSLQHDVVRQVKARSALQLSLPDDNGWSAVYAINPSDGGIPFAPSAFDPIRLVSDTVGFVKESVLTDDHSRILGLAAPERRGSVYRLQSEYGTIHLHSSSDWWNDEHLVAIIDSGTRVQVLERVRIDEGGGFVLERCLVETMGHEIVTGWVFCSDVRR